MVVQSFEAPPTSVSKVNRLMKALSVVKVYTVEDNGNITELNY